MLRTSGTLEKGRAAPSDTELHQAHAQMVERIARDLSTSLFESARNFREPAAHLVAEGLDDLDIDAAVAGVRRDAIQTENLSEAFRAHAYRMLDTWWTGHKGQRRALEALDAVLAMTPAAIAAPLSIYAGGVGVPETLLFAGPLVEQFLARVVEYQFGDAMFDFLSPWRQEQREALADALRAHALGPALEPMRAYLDALDDATLTEMEQWLSQCRPR
jgi:hypothetical protein